MAKEKRFAAIITLVVLLLLAAGSGGAYWYRHHPAMFMKIAPRSGLHGLTYDGSYDRAITKADLFATRVCSAPDGDLWMAAEERGVGRYDQAGGTWRWYTKADGAPADDVYALATDRQGRLWAGHLGGVCVFNGQKWKDYTAADGPLGGCVFAICVCPVDGDVWIATDCGLSRYSVADDAWTYITRAEGLPCDQITSLAFDPTGNLILGTPNSGVILGQRADNYAHWRNIGGLDRPAVTSGGDGLPSNIIHAVAASTGGHMYASTPNGLAFSKDAGAHWGFIRGNDWRDKTKQMYKSPGPQGDDRGAVLSEDWCISLALAADGTLYVGHRNTGVDVLDGESLQLRENYGNDLDKMDPIMSLQILPAAGVLCSGHYGRGMGIQPIAPASVAAEVQTSDEAPFPAAAKPPSPSQLAELQRHVEALEPATMPAQFLGDDWSTGGDWIGRYGREYVYLPALERRFGRGLESISIGDELGPHYLEKVGGPYTYLVWDKSKDSNRAIFDPIIGVRGFGEINDGSFSHDYPQTWEGPDIWLQVSLPKGLHRLSLYMVSNDGHGGRTILREFPIEVRGANSGPEAYPEGTVLLRTGVNNFYNGVYKQFSFRGPAQYWIRIGRNYSRVTKLFGIMVDGLPAAPGAANGLPAYAAAYQPPAIAQSANNTSAAVQSARALWASLDAAYDREGGAAMQRPYRTLAYRAAAAGGADPDLLENWRWQIGLWTATDRNRFDTDVIKQSPVGTGSRPPPK